MVKSLIVVVFGALWLETSFIYILERFWWVFRKCRLNNIVRDMTGGRRDKRLFCVVLRSISAVGELSVMCGTGDGSETWTGDSYSLLTSKLQRLGRI
jgi:hypothetical protein